MHKTEILANISASDIKKYAISIRACVFSQNACEMESKFGNLIVNLESIGGDFCILKVRRKSGNGIISIKQAGVSSSFTVTSKTIQDLRIDLNNGKIIALKRPPQSIGALEVLSLHVYKNVLDEEPIRESNIAVNWRNTLKKCAEAKGVRLVGDQLIVAEGATIKAKKILRIKTLPDRIFKLSEDKSKINFFASGKIIELHVEEGEKIPQIFDKHIEPPAPIIEVIESKAPAEKPIEKNSKPLIEQLPKIKKSQIGSHIIYDTEHFGYFQKSFCKTPDTKVSNNNKSVVIGHKGLYSIPLSGLLNDQEYIISVEATKVNGNGKFQINFSPTKSPNQALIAQSHKKFYNAARLTSNADNAHLNIERHPTSSGNIIVTRIIIVPGVTKPNTVEVIKAAQAPSTEEPINKKAAQWFLSHEDDIEKAKMQLRARHRTMHSIPQRYDDVKASIQLNSISAKSWYSKIKPLFPNVKVSKNKPEILFTSVYGIDNNFKYKVIHLEEFEEKDITSEIIAKLKNFRKIVTSSESNSFFLQEKLDREIHTIPRHWPMPQLVKTPFDNNRYMLSFARNDNNENLKLLFKTCKEIKGCPKLIVVGARGRYPNFVQPINEYLHYGKLANLILNADVVIDLPKNAEYSSGALHMAMKMKRNVLTTNWCAFSYEHTEFVPIENNKVEEELLKDGLEKSLGKLINPKGINAEEHNEELKESLVNLFS